MEKKVWKIDVVGINGYSFAVSTTESDPKEVIELAREADLFEEDFDAIYASAEEITGDEYEMKFWGNQVTEL